MRVFRSSAGIIASSGLTTTPRWTLWLRETLPASRGFPWALALIDQLIAGGANFVTILMLGRLAGAQELGVFTLAMTVYYPILAVQESLITMPYTIFRARFQGDEYHQYSGAALFQSAALASVVGIILAVVALLSYLVRGDDSFTQVVAAFMLMSPLALLREFGRRYLFAHMHVGLVVVMSLMASTTQIVALAFFAYTSSLSAATALCATGFGCGVAALSWLLLSRRAFHFNKVQSSNFLLKNWLLGRWQLGIEATAILSANVMPWLIALFLGTTATGIFAACDSILRFTNPVSIAIRNVFTPKVAIDHSNGGKSAVSGTVWKTTGFLILFQGVFLVLLTVAGEQILKSSFGAAYGAYWAVLVVLAFNQLLAKAALAPGRALFLVDHARIVLRAEIAALGISLAAAAMLAPSYGVLGAAFSVVAGNLLFAGWTLGACLAVMRDDKEAESPLLIRSSASATVAGGVSE